jgi:hypothetical protein
LPWRNARKIESERDLGFLRGIIGQIEGSSDDMSTGKDLACTHKEACANDLSSRCANAHQ